MLEAARAGGVATTAVEAAGRAAVAPDDVIDGRPRARRRGPARGPGRRRDAARRARRPARRRAGRWRRDGPGAIVPARRPAAAGADDRERRSLVVRNTSRRVVRVSSHYPVRPGEPAPRVRPRRGRRLPPRPAAGASERWAPGETRTVELVRFGGAASVGATAARPMTRSLVPGRAPRPLRPDDRRPGPARRHRPVGPRRARTARRPATSRSGATRRRSGRG